MANYLPFRFEKHKTSINFVSAHMIPILYDRDYIQTDLRNNQEIRKDGNAKLAS